MPEYLSPGVYVEEIDTGPKPITPVATSTAGAVGVTRKGSLAPSLLTSYGDFARQYGAPLDIPDDATRAVWDGRGHWWHAAQSVKAFFDEGGARLYFQRVQPGGAIASTAAFHGGLVAQIAADVAPADTVVRLSHVVNIAPGAHLDLVSATGTALAAVTVAAVDYGARTVTLSTAAGVSAQRGQDIAVITPVATALNTLTVSAASAGVWGDDLTVRILPAVGARLELGATPTSGAPVRTATTAPVAAGATTVQVASIAGSLDAATAVPFTIQINGAATASVSAVAANGANVDLTVTHALATALPAGSAVAKLRTASAAEVVTVTGAARMYPGAVVQLEGSVGAELGEVTAVAGNQVTLAAAPTNPYLEGEAITLLEAEVSVAYRPASGDPATELIAGVRLTDDGQPDSLVRRINSVSKLIQVALGPDYDGTDLTHFPAAVGPPWVPLSNGEDALASLDVADFVGVNLGPGARTGIQALEDIDEVAIVLVPGMWSVDIRSALIVHCETLTDRFAIIDSPPGLSVQDVQAFRSPIDTKYAALYYPWVQVRDLRPGGGSLAAPPSGFIAGVYARTDIARGVHKAPANEVLRSIQAIEQSITKREQDVLNPVNINVLRAFPGRGNRVWGARVLTSDSAWRYVPVRRLFIMIEESIDEATQWVVFEPNDEPLWARVRQSVSRFLLSQWRIGALQGTKADEAFFVACDRSTMTQDDIDNGRLICQIGIAPVKPAEFVIFRIQQKTLDITA